MTGRLDWNAGDGFTFSGGASSGGNASSCPTTCSPGWTTVTVDFDVWVDPTLAGNWFMFNLGNTATYPNGTGYLFVTGKDSSSRLRGTIAENGFATEQSASRAGGLTTGAWKHVTFTVNGGTAAAPGASRLYEDGVLVASNTNHHHQAVADRHARRHHDAQRPRPVGVRRRPVLQGQAPRLPDLLAGR